MAQILDQIVNLSTCVAAIGLVIATCVLVSVTRHHARHAEKLATAADRLGDVAQLHALVVALASRVSLDGGKMPGSQHNRELENLIMELQSAAP